MKMKKENAITIISLVITIIILLILAGVTISLTMGENGIFKLAQDAGKNYMDAQNNEIAQLQNYGNTIGQVVGSTNKSDIKKFTIEASELQMAYSDGSTDTQINLIPKRDIKKAILVYSVGMGHSGANANAKLKETVVSCNSNGFTASLINSQFHCEGSSYTGSVLQEVYVVENINANDTINIKGCVRWIGGCTATLISYEM